MKGCTVRCGRSPVHFAWAAWSAPDGVCSPNGCIMYGLGAGASTRRDTRCLGWGADPPKAGVNQRGHLGESARALGCISTCIRAIQ
jgi:hypothetical protein